MRQRDGAERQTCAGTRRSFFAWVRRRVTVRTGFTPGMSA